MSTRLAVMFLTALLGVVIALGLAMARLGAPVALVYVLAVLVASVLLARRARLLRARSRSASRAVAGRTCTCCTTSVHDPVKVI